MINPQLYYLSLILFISEYVFDFIILSNQYRYQLKKKLVAYLFLQIIIVTLCIILPSIIIPLTIYLFMFHFGEDIRYIFNEKAAYRWFGAILFSINIFFNFKSYTLIFKTFLINEETILYLLINCILLIIPSFIIIPCKIKNIFITLFIFIIGYNKIMFGLVPYMIFIHLPLTIYRLNKKFIIEPTFAIISLILVTIPVNLFISLFFKSIYFKYHLIGLLINHILFISKWKLKHL